MSWTQEQVADFLAKKSLEFFKNEGDSIDVYQKEVSGGNVNVNRDPNNPLVIYKSDLKANIEEYAHIVINENIQQNNLENIVSEELWLEFKDIYLNSPENVGQFINFETSQSIINPDLAAEVLDSDINELVPTLPSRQQQIDNWFEELNNLIDPAPDFNEEPVDSGNWVMTSEWNDISSVPSSPSGSISRIETESDDYNYSRQQTIEQLRNRLSFYLLDVDGIPSSQRLDERPQYQNDSEGYLKFRNLNQSIIIRQEQGTNNISFAETDPATGYPKYLLDGFTLTKWVRFANKVDGGTLFNFGNPLRETNPHGFRLETFIIENGTVATDASTPSHLFQDSLYERFIRLSVMDETGVLRDSLPYRDGYDVGSYYTPDLNNIDGPRIFHYTHIPVDINEWYFIVANYNPSVNEDESYGVYDSNHDWWRWNMNEDGTYTNFSSLGAKCKVEIISRTDLLRARGYQS
tara:strand:- start:1270 stop:2658 length:1389 start_codon:yes stop_codon:yes gene_type:complete